MSKFSFLPSQAKEHDARMARAKAKREAEINNRIALNWARYPNQERFGDDR